MNDSGLYRGTSDGGRVSVLRSLRSGAFVYRRDGGREDSKQKAYPSPSPLVLLIRLRVTPTD